ncbi:MAG TPA: c-type cytochrome [Gammaproteobacteria bacterium]
MKKIGLLLLMLAFVAPPLESFAADGFNKFKVRRIVSKNKCFKCHAVEREKVGPAYINVSKKFNEDPNGRQKIYTHLTTSPTIKVEGRDETHVNLKAGGDADINEVISWLLSLAGDPDSLNK